MLRENEERKNGYKMWRNRTLYDLEEQQRKRVKSEEIEVITLDKESDKECSPEIQECTSEEENTKKGDKRNVEEKEKKEMQTWKRKNKKEREWDIVLESSM